MDRRRIPLGEIVPDPVAIDRVMDGGYQGSVWPPAAHNSGVDQDAAYASFEEMEANDPDIIHARKIFEGAATLEKIPRVPGRLLETVMGAFDDTVADWQQQYPDITPQEVALLTKPIDFTDYGDRQRIVVRHKIDEEQLKVLRPRHLFNAVQNARSYSPALEAQQLPPGLLDIPDYVPQLTTLGCMTSCYRMIFKALAGDKLEAPCEYAMTSLSEYGGFTFDEEILFKSLANALFRQKTGYLVTNRVLIGADFDDIAKRAALVKDRLPGSKVYATVGLKNFDHTVLRLHGALLLDADEDTVRFHNPWAREHQRSPNCINHNSDGCGAFDTLDKTEFIERWAASMHETRLVIARPDPANTD